ncbi:MAG: ABC transporter ATP-binding protein [candidate division WOR-3 bacterium]|nr:ABC transporter ATP-binding protein [candidate division WOR-3 bacterium]
MQAVIIQNLYKNFGNIKAVDGISLEIAQGEIFGLIGPNGAGKTTTLRMIATLLKPSSGTIEVFGFNVEKEDNRVRELISYLPEEAGAYKNLRGIDYLKFMAGFYARNGNDKNKIIEKALEIARLGNRINDRIRTYSKGMVRKLLLARALMHNPKLLILDEPTSGLDVMNSLEIRNLIIDYAKGGTTVIVSSHNMLEVEYLSDRVAFIHNGKIIESGVPAELRNKYQAENLEQVFVKSIRQ